MSKLKKKNRNSRNKLKTQGKTSKLERKLEKSALLGPWVPEKRQKKPELHTTTNPKGVPSQTLFLHIGNRRSKKCQLMDSFP